MPALQKGHLWEYYHFIVDFAPRFVFEFLNDAPCTVHVLYVPDWPDLHQEKYHLLKHRETARSMANHFDALLGPLGLELVYVSTRDQLQALPVPVFGGSSPWSPHKHPWSTESPVVYETLRNYAWATVGRGASALAVQVVVIRRKAQFGAAKQATGLDATGAGRRHLPREWFAHCEAYLKELGVSYRVVVLDNMPIGRQIRLFSSVDMIIGLHGAALSNAMFARPGTHVVEVGQIVYECYAPLCAKLGMYYTHVNTTDFGPEMKDAILRRFGVDYTMAHPYAAFESAMQSMAPLRYDADFSEFYHTP